MRALARLATAVAREGQRSMSYTSNAAQLMQLAGKKPASSTADKVGMAVMLPLAAAFLGYDLLYPEEEFEGKIPAYPYLRMRTRAKYPWGNDMGPFEHHRFIGGDDEEHH